MRETFFHQQLQFSRSYKKRLNEKLSSAGLFHSQWLVLYCIKKQQPVTLVQVSAYLDVEKPTVSRTVKRLEEQNLVREIPSPDKRERLVCLTDQGEETYQLGQEIVIQFEMELMKDISDEDIGTTTKTIQYLKEKLSKEEIS